MLTNCFRFAPRDSVPGLIAKICKYLKDHPGWSEEELEEQIQQILGETGVESFNGRTGAVVLNEDDVNNLKIASAYFAEGDVTIDELDLVTLYNQGVRFVFTNWNSVTSGYDLAFVLDYFSGSNDVVYYPMSTGSGGGNIVSVNGKTGIVELSLSDILGDSGAQVKLCTATEFTANTLETWNAYYDEGYRIIGVVNSDASAVDYIYLLKQDENKHRPIGLSTGADDAYSPSNPPPYPVTGVNGFTGEVNLSSVRTSDALRYMYVGTETNANQIRLTRRGSLSSTTSYVDTLSFPNASPFLIKRRHYISGSGIDVTDTFYTDRNPPPYPVTSVNGMTGEVVIPQTGAGVTSVNGKTGAVTGVYDAENPPPYPVTSVNDETGAITVKRIYSPDGNAHVRQANPDATHTRAFYAESTFDGVRSLISCSFDENDDIHMQIKRGDGSWRDAILYTTKNLPPSSASSLDFAIVTTEVVSGNRHIVYYNQLPGIANEEVDSIISVLPIGAGAYYLRPRYYSDDAFELSVYGDLTDIDYQIDVKIIYEV